MTQMLPGDQKAQRTNQFNDRMQGAGAGKRTSLFATTAVLALLVLTLSVGCSAEAITTEVVPYEPEPSVYTVTYESAGAILVQQVDEKGDFVTKGAKDEEGKDVELPQTVNLGTYSGGLIPVAQTSTASPASIIRMNSLDDEEGKINKIDTQPMSCEEAASDLNESLGTGLIWDEALAEEIANRPEQLKENFATNNTWHYGGNFIEIPMMGIGANGILEAIESLPEFQKYFKDGYTHFAVVSKDGYSSVVLWGPTEEYPSPPSEQTVLAEPIATTPLTTNSMQVFVEQVADTEIPGINFQEESVVVLEDAETIDVDSGVARIGFSLQSATTGEPIGTSIYNPDKDGYMWQSFVTVIAGHTFMTNLPRAISGTEVVEVSQSAIDDVIKVINNLKDAGNLASAAAIADAVLEILGTEEPIYANLVTAVTETRAQVQTAIEEAEAARIAAEEAAAAQQQNNSGNGYTGGNSGNSGNTGGGGVIERLAWICIDESHGHIIIGWVDQGGYSGHEGHIVVQDMVPVGAG